MPTDTTLSYFSFAVLPPVRKPRPVNTASLGSALIGRLIEESLNGCTGHKPTVTSFLYKSLSK